MRFSVVSVLFKILMLFCCLVLQAYGTKDMVLLSIELDVEKPCVSCNCGAESDSKETKPIRLEHETSQVEAFVYYFTVVEENPGSCSCLISWGEGKSHESSEGDFLVYNSDIAKKQGSDHPFYMMLQAASEIKPERFIVWLVTVNGVYPPGHPAAMKIWTKTKHRESCFLQ